MRPPRSTLVAALGLAACVLARDAAPQPAPSAAAAAPPATAIPNAPAPPGAIDARPVAEATAKLVDEVRGWGGRAGVLVVDLATGATLASADEHGAFNP